MEKLPRLTDALVSSQFPNEDDSATPVGQDGFSISPFLSGNAVSFDVAQGAVGR